MIEWSVVSFSSIHWNQLNRRPADRHFPSTVYQYVGFKVAHIPDIEPCTEKVLLEPLRSLEIVSDLVLVITPRVNVQVWIQAAEVGVPPYMVPMRMRNENRRQLRQILCIRAQRLIGFLSVIRPRASVNSDELPPVV